MERSQHKYGESSRRGRRDKQLSEYLSDGVVHVDGWHPQSARLHHLLEFVRSGGGLFTKSANACAMDFTLLLHDDSLNPMARRHTSEIFRVLRVNEGCEAAAVVENHIERLPVWEHQRLHMTFQP